MHGRVVDRLVENALGGGTFAVVGEANGVAAIQTVGVDDTGGDRNRPGKHGGGMDDSLLAAADVRPVVTRSSW